MIPLLSQDLSDDSRPSCDVLKDVRNLIKMHKAGMLGGAMMPEDVHPPLPRYSHELWHYFTLGMALNYQRNSYSLWKAATATYDDPTTRKVFDPRSVARMSVEELAPLLLKHRLALQPNKHAKTWHTLCVSIFELFDGNVQNLFRSSESRIDLILSAVQVTHKKRFPYLSGPKIANYWLYVMGQYTDAGLLNRDALSVAPDTHVIQSTRQLGVISSDETLLATAPILVSSRWRTLLENTGIAPIDIHTPFWLWSRGGFSPIFDFGSESQTATSESPEHKSRAST